MYIISIGNQKSKISSVGSKKNMDISTGYIDKTLVTTRCTLLVTREMQLSAGFEGM